MEVNSEVLLRNTIDSSMDMIQVFKAVRDEANEIVDFIWILNNKASEAIYGDVIGKSLLTLNPGVVKEGIFNTFKKVVETGEPDQSLIHYTHEQFNGWFHQSTVKLDDGVTTTTRDVTEVKKAEQELEESHVMLQSIIDNSLDIVQVFEAVRDEANTIIDFKWTIQNQKGFQQNGPVIGKSLLKQNPGVKEAGLFDKFIEVTENGTPVEQEVYYGYEQFNSWFHQTLVKLNDGFVMTTKDITNRKAAELELEASKNLVQTVFEVSLNPIAYHKAVRDASGKIIDFEFQLENYEARKYALEDRTGKLYSETYPGISDTTVFRMYCDVVETGQRLDTEVQLGPKDTERWFHLMAVKLGDGLVATALDITERKIAEQEIKELAHFIKSVTDTTPAIISITTCPSGTTVFSNRDTFAALGFDADELAQMDLADRLKLVHPDDRAFLKDYYDQLGSMTDKQELRIEYRLRNKKEEWLWLETKGKVFKRDAEGKATQLLHIAQDITAQKNAAREILQLKDEIAQRAEDKYRTLFESINQGFYIAEVVQDDTGRVIGLRHLEVNPAVKQMAGVDAVGKPINEVMPGLEPRWLEPFDRIVRDGEPLEFEHYHEPTGRWYKASYALIGERGSRLVGVIVDDTTERKQREQYQQFLIRFSDALRAEPDADAIANRAVRMLAEHLRLDRCYVGIASLDANLGVFPYQFGNDRVPPMQAEGVRLSDFPEALRKTFDETLVIMDFQIMEELSDAEKQNFAMLGFGALIVANVRKEEKNPYWSLNAVSATPRHWTDIEIQLIEEATERTWAAIERAKAEEALRESETQSKRLLKLRDEFIGVASHELNTPVTSMKVYAEIVREKVELSGDAYSADLLARLNAQIERISSLIVTLLDTTRIAEGNLQLTFEEINLMELISERTEEISRVSNHQFETHIQPLPPVDADRERVGQVITNLLSNAIKYSPKGSTVSVAAALEGDMVKITVEDQGFGIPQDDIPRIFERFFRVTANKMSTYPGMGLGLYISAQIVERHGGTFSVQSTLGSGSAFSFTLPLKQS